MKFKKSSSVSPKMELLTRRSHATGAKSTFKRSRSFRASVKLMSKIRNHGNLRIAVGLQPTDNATSTKEDSSKRNILPAVPESPSSVKILEEATNVVLARRARASERSVVVKDEQSRRNCLNASATREEKANRARNDETKERAKSKLSFTERIMGMHLRSKEESKKAAARQATPSRRKINDKGKCFPALTRL